MLTIQMIYDQRGSEMSLPYIDAPAIPELNFVPICPGIQFAVVRISSTHWPQVSFNSGDDYLLLNYCQDGRCEVELDDDTSVCLTAGDICLCTSRRVNKPFYFPTGYYNGIEISLDMNYFKSGKAELLGSSLEIIADIPDKFDLKERTFASKATSEVRSILTEIYSSALCDDILFLKLRLLQLLITLEERDQSSATPLRTAYPKSRGRIAREISRIISEDLSVHITISQFAQQFDVSEGSLKNIIRSVYGHSYSDHLRLLRIRAAMSALADTDRSIADIAASVGYENQSKFAAAFRKINGISPLEYRRMQKTGR